MPNDTTYSNLEKMTATRYLYALILMAGLGACSGGTTSQESPATLEAAREDSLATKRVPLDNLVNDYLRLKDALVASNPETAKQQAIALLQVVDATQMPDVQQIIKQMAANDTLAVQRRHFSELSQALYPYIKNHEGNEQTLYKQYCPMAFDNQGAFWLSNIEEIRNPYFGDEMLTCGRVEEEISF